MAETYKIVRFYALSSDRDIVRTGLTLDEAQAHCRDPETSSRTCEGAEGVARFEEKGAWFEGYEAE